MTMTSMAEWSSKPRAHWFFQSSSYCAKGFTHAECGVAQTNTAATPPTQQRSAARVPIDAALRGARTLQRSWCHQTHLPQDAGAYSVQTLPCGSARQRAKRDTEWICTGRRVFPACCTACVRWDSRYAPPDVQLPSPGGAAQGVLA